MEEYVTFVVQSWIKDYEYWTDTAELPTGMFDLPRVGYDTEEEGNARLEQLRQSSPGHPFRLVKRTTITEVLVLALS